MPPRPRRKKSGSPKAAPARAEPVKLPSEASGLRARIQILAGFLLPLVVLGIWLNSRGFFGSP